MTTMHDCQLTLFGLITESGLDDIIEAISNSFAGLPHDPHASFRRGVNTVYAHLPCPDVPARIDATLTGLGVSYLWITHPLQGPARDYSDVAVYDAETHTHLRAQIKGEEELFGQITPLKGATSTDSTITATLPSMMEINECANGWHLEIVDSAHAALGHLSETQLRPGLVAAHFRARAAVSPEIKV